MTKIINEVTPPGYEDRAIKMKPDFKKSYGERWKEVLYRTLWKQKKNEEAQLDEATKLNLVARSRQQHSAALKRQYTRNENENRHLANATMLAQHFGSHEEHGRGLDLMKQHKKLGYLPDGGMEYESEMNKKYYKRLLGQNEETQLDEAKVTWGDVLKKHPDYNISTLFKKEQRGFDNGLKEINQERKKEGLKRTTAGAIRREYNPRYMDPSENPTPPAIGRWEYEHIRKGKPIK